MDWFDGLKLLVGDGGASRRSAMILDLQRLEKGGTESMTVYFLFYAALYRPAFFLHYFLFATFMVEKSFPNLKISVIIAL